ncbi:MFS general substrate transporter [Trichoderma citrinoviride]|uniref:MFS general substrate transporter n=1 Tax=Trichoderma citrinoviride TaxID=58853 RepID=A0A2T4BE69_9HYPO|nr:MFS general substrate transporter [Trichoderma citrinoviride]PTB67637.1 MFS general substrate transporter [Trichoderma citrinoviride]
MAVLDEKHSGSGRPSTDVRDTEVAIAAEEVVCPPHTTERRLMAKVDMRVVPFLCIMYLLAFLDRVNIANAKLFGLATDLDLGTGDKYNTALVIFFVPYCIFEVPSNILLKKFKPHVWLSLNMFLFGFTTMMQGLVKNYSGLLATRFFLGLFETGMFPGAFYLIGMWYKRSEAQRRYSFFFNSTTLAGAFGGLLAAAIGKMDGMRGYSGWRWIFLIEGGLTVLVSFFFFFLLPDFPEEAKWLKEDERTYVAARLRVDQGTGSGATRSMTVKDALNVFKDWKIIAGGFMYFGLIVPAYGYAYFAPTIISTFHYGPIETQLRSVPPWAAAFGFSLLIATLSDRLRHRFAFAIFSMLIAIAGFAILLAEHSNADVQYGALFLITSGAYTAMPIIVCWFNMNLGNHTRRAVGSAWQVGYGNLGGIIAVFIFLTKDAPKFTTGYSVCLAFTVLSMVASALYGFGCMRANKQRDSMTDVPELSEDEKTALGDLSPDYRYLL